MAAIATDLMLRKTVLCPNSCFFMDSAYSGLEFDTVRKKALIDQSSGWDGLIIWQNRASSWSRQPPKTNSYPAPTPQRRPADPRVPDRGRGREAHEGGQWQPLGPSRRHHDPCRLPARPAGRRAGGL